MSSPLADEIRAKLAGQSEHASAHDLYDAVMAVADKCEEVRGGLFTDGIDLANDIESTIARALGIKES
jgi:hypothetical protein